MVTSPKNIVVVGSSGHAKVVIDVVEKEGRHRIAGLVDSFRGVGETAFGYRVLGAEADLAALVHEFDLSGCIVAIGDNWKRHLVAETTANLAPSLELVTAIHPSAQIARGVTIGRGTVVMAGGIVNSDGSVGECCIVNTRASLDHDSRMEDFSSLAPHAAIGGDVKIGAFTAVSLGANVIHGRSIGRHTVIGAGATVLHDIPGFSVAYGTPASVVRQRKEGEEYLSPRESAAQQA